MIKQDPNMLEERVAHLEEEMSRLKSRLPQKEGDLGWPSGFDGIFEDDALTEEANRLGRQWRENQQDGPTAP